jgi:DNA segregation ATPase FtsK/SpoIIIE, S-DNA-T family
VVVLVWGAWREAFDRAVAEHRAARATLQSALAPTSASSTREVTAVGAGTRADAAVTASFGAVDAAAARLPGGWAGADWAALAAAPPSPAGEAEAPLRIGVVRAGEQPEAAPFHLRLLGHGHLTVDAPVRDARVAGLLQGILLRALAVAPPGTVRVIAHDPAGLGRVFEPFADLVGAGVLTDVGPGREGLLAALDAAETQVRSRPEADPRPGLVVVLAGLSAGAAPEVDARLAALAHAGPAARVSLVVAGWTAERPVGHPPPPGLENTVELRARGGAWSPGLPGVGRELDLPVELDPAPPPDLVRQVCRAVADAADRHARPTFADLDHAPVWGERSGDGLATPVGRTPDGRPHVLHFNDATPHWLVGGRSGAGKTVFLLDVLAGLAVRYPPSELAIHLLDFKEGVSFTEFTPTPHDPSWLPHAVAVGVESDREYGLAVLRALRAEMSRRATAFKRAGVTGIAALRAVDPTAAVPRVLAVIDEFQVLFAGNDDTARQASGLLEDLARKGRSFGVHLVLASQTASGIEALQTKMEAIFGQFPLRVALAGGSSVLDPLNTAADDLPVGTAVVNASGGVPGANTVVRLPLAEPTALATLRHRLWEGWVQLDPEARPPAVFEGFAEQHVTDDPVFAALATGGLRRQVLVGRAVDVGSPTAAVTLDAVPGRHLAVLGPSAVGADVLHAALLGLGRQHEPGTAEFVVAPLVPAGDDAAAAAASTLAEAGHLVRTVPLTRLGPVLAELAGFGAVTPDRPVYLALFGAEAAGPGLSVVSPETFRSGTDDLRAVVQSGPLHGIHVLGWWRSLARFGSDLGPSARDDVACLLVLNVPGTDLASFLGRYDLHHEPRANRGLLIDQHDDAVRPVVPFVRETGVPAGGEDQ